MKTYILVLSIISITAVRCITNPFTIATYHPNDLRYFLNWSRMLHCQCIARREEYEETMNDAAESLALPDYSHIGEILSEFVAKASEMRDHLVKGGIGRVTVSEEMEENVTSMMMFVLRMNEVFHDLRARIDEWQNHGEGLARAIIRVKHRTPFWWFKKHGFDAHTLRNITVNRLKGIVDSISGPGKPLDRLLEFFGIILFLPPKPVLSGDTVWLFSFGGTDHIVNQLEQHLRKNENDNYAELITELIACIREVGAPDSPLRNLIGEGKDDGLYTFYKKMAKHAIFLESKVEVYLEMLIELCGHLEGDLRDLEKLLRNSFDDELVIGARKFGFMVDEYAIDEREIPDKIHALMGETGIVTRLCKAVEAYAIVVDFDTHQSPDEAHSNLRA